MKKYEKLQHKTKKHSQSIWLYERISTDLY